jgi:hypothetical protein
VLIGPSEIADAAIAMLRPHLKQPVAEWDPCITHNLSRIGGGALVVQRIERLNEQQQRQLLEYVDDHRGAVQIICTAEDGLFRHVQCGAFHEALYYRLNTVCVRAEMASVG